MADKGIDAKQYEEAKQVVAEAGQASVSMIQRRLRVGYTTASKIVEQLEADGHVGPYEGSKPRVVHIKPEDMKPVKKQRAPRKAAAAAKGGKGTKAAPKGKTPQKGTEKPKKDRTGIGGRPRLWNELKMDTKLDAVRGWSMQGATMVELAEMLGVSETTVYEWQGQYPKFAEAVRAGRNIANGDLLNAAFRASTGFHTKGKAAIKVKTFKAFNVTDPKTGQTGEVLKAVEEVVEVDVTEYVPPNANLLQFMLTNRLPDQYRKKEHVEINGGGGGNYGYMTDEELDAEIAAMEKGGVANA